MEEQTTTSNQYQLIYKLKKWFKKNLALTQNICSSNNIAIKICCSLKCEIQNHFICNQFICQCFYITHAYCRFRLLKYYIQQLQRYFNYVLDLGKIPYFNTAKAKYVEQILKKDKLTGSSTAKILLIIENEVIQQYIPIRKTLNKQQRQTRRSIIRKLLHQKIKNIKTIDREIILRRLQNKHNKKLKTKNQLQMYAVKTPFYQYVHNDIDSNLNYKVHVLIRNQDSKQIIEVRLKMYKENEYIGIQDDNYKGCIIVRNDSWVQDNKNNIKNTVIKNEIKLQKDIIKSNKKNRHNSILNFTNSTNNELIKYSLSNISQINKLDYHIFVSLRQLSYK